MTAGLVLFHLFVNAAVAFAGALGLVALARRVLRVEPGRLALLLLTLPFLKGALELARGVPADGFFWARLAGATQDQGAFRVGLGLTAPAVPVIELSLGAIWHGRTYTQSVGDLAIAGLTRWAGAEVPAAIGFGLGAATALALASFAVERWRASGRQAALLRSAELLEVRPLGRRRVRLVVTPGAEGVPCAGGLVRPWIWLPGATWAALDAEEREAVVAHELAHLRGHDLLILSLVETLRRVLAVVPGAGAVARAVRVQAELAADVSARRAARAEALASALVRVAERGRARTAAPAPLALVRPGAVLAVRVARLLRTPEPEPRRLRRLVRAAGILMTFGAVLRATFFGDGW